MRGKAFETNITKDKQRVKSNFSKGSPEGAARLPGVRGITPAPVTQPRRGRGMATARR